MMWWDGDGWGTGAWMMMSLLMIVFWAGLIVVVIWLVRSVSTDHNVHQAAPSSTTSAQEVLAQRFARGEIDEDEFKRRRDLLRSGGQGG